MERNDEIRVLVDDFAGQLQAIVKRMALQEIADVLDAATSGARRGRKPGKRGRKAGRKQGRKAGGRGGKRSSEQVDAMAGKVLAFVKKNPDLRGEQISKAMHTDTNTIRLPMQKLIAEKKIKTKGQRRGMTYRAA
jgi:hypothetical protein